MTSTVENSDVFAAIADKTRRKLLRRLASEGERTVTQLLQPLSISQPALSKHLRLLREAGLVQSRKEGRLRLYSIEAQRLREVFDWVSQFEKYWDSKLDALGGYLDKQAKRKKK